MNDTCMNHIEQHWQTLTLKYNELFNQGDFQQALSGYTDALCRAELLNNHLEECIRLKIPFIQVYIISCNNLANTYEALGQTEEAEKMLKRVIYYCLHLSGKEHVKQHEIQTELKRATIAYSGFIQKTTSETTKQEQFFRTLNEHLLENNLIKTE